MSEMLWDSLGGATLTDLGVTASSPILPLMLKKKLFALP